MNRTFRMLVACVALGSQWTAGREIHVAQGPDAADSNPGTPDQPYLTLGKACAEAQAGDTVFIRSGTYREALIPQHSGEPGRPILFQAFSNETVMIKGSIPLTGFAPEGDGLWVVRPWTRSFWWSDELCRGISAAPFQASARQEQVFVNEEPLQWVPSRTELRPGSFFWNAAPEDGAHAGELVIHPPAGVTNLNAALVEIPVLPTVVGAWPGDVPRGWTEIRWARKYSPDGNTATAIHPEIHHIHIRGLKFRHAAHTLNRAGVRLDGDHWVLEDCAVEYMNAIGVAAGGDHCIVRRCWVSHNGQGGISGAGSASLFEDVTTCYNNRKLYAIGWGGSGNKFGVTREGSTVRRLVSAFNHGSGLWYDIDCVNVVVEDSLVFGNRPINAGFFYEISWDGLFRNNVSFANHQPGSGFYGAAFVLSDSASTRVEDNVAIGGSGAFAVGASRGPRQDKVFETERDWWLGSNNLVRANLVVEPHDFTISVRRKDRYDSSRPEANNRFEANTYLLRHGAGHVRHGVDAYADPLALEAATTPSAGNRIATDLEQLAGADRQRLNAAFTRIAGALNLAAPELNLIRGAIELEQIWALDAECRVIGYWLRDGDQHLLLLDLPAAATLQLFDSAATAATLWDFPVLKPPVRSVMEDRQGLLSARAEGPCALITGLTAGARPLAEVFGVRIVVDGQLVTAVLEDQSYEAQLRIANPLPSPLDVTVTGPGLDTPWKLELPAAGIASTNLPLVARPYQDTIRYELHSDRLPTLRRASPLRIEKPAEAAFWREAFFEPGDPLENPRMGAAPLRLDRESQRVKALYDERTGRAWKGPEDLSAEIRMGWNETGLFVSAHLRDDVLAPHPDTPYTADCLEIFLDGRTTRLGERLYTAGAYQFLCAAPDPEIAGWQPLTIKPLLPDGPAGRARVVSGGYELDVRIPWSLFPELIPAPGAVLGVDFALDDADEHGTDGRPVRHTQLVWRGTSENWRDASLFGRVRLASAAEVDFGQAIGPGDIVVRDEAGLALYRDANGSRPLAAVPLPTAGRHAASFMGGGVAFDALRNLYFLDGAMNHRLQVVPAGEGRSRILHEFAHPGEDVQPYLYGCNLVAVDSDQLLVLTSDGLLAEFSPSTRQTGRHVRLFRGARGGGLSLSPDGLLLAAASASERGEGVALFRMDNLSEVGRLPDHAGLLQRPSALAFVPSEPPFLAVIGSFQPLDDPALATSGDRAAAHALFAGSPASRVHVLRLEVDPSDPAQPLRAPATSNLADGRSFSLLANRTSDGHLWRSTFTALAVDPARQRVLLASRTAAGENRRIYAAPLDRFISGGLELTDLTPLFATAGSTVFGIAVAP